MGSWTLCFLMVPWSLVMALVFHDLAGGAEAWIAIVLPVVVFGVYGSTAARGAEHDTGRPDVSPLQAEFQCGRNSGGDLFQDFEDCRTRRCTEWRPRDVTWQFGSRGGAAIGELNR
jgi:hypothetical protein